MDFPILVLAGGLGTRLGPNVSKLPKYMVDICGNPFAYWQLKFFKEQGFYEALGSRRITKDLEGTWNPLKFFQGLKDIGIRMKDKGIEGNFAGNGLVLGGVFVIDTDAEAITYTYKEATGKEIPRDEIADAVKAVRNQKSNIFSNFV